MKTLPTWLLDWKTLDHFPASEIATGLSRICRFGGLCPAHYSVARHSLLVSELLHIPRLKLLGLLHDAHEVFTGDVLRPAGKVAGAPLRELQAEIDQHLFSLIGLDPCPADITQVAIADDQALEMELEWLGKPWGETIAATGSYHFLSYSQEEDEDAWLAEYRRLVAVVCGMKSNRGGKRPNSGQKPGPHGIQNLGER